MADATLVDFESVLPSDEDLTELGFDGFQPAIDADGSGAFSGAWVKISPENRAQIGIDTRVQSVKISPETCTPAFDFIWAPDDGSVELSPKAAGRIMYSDNGRYEVSRNDRVVRVVAHQWGSPEIARNKFEAFADAAMGCLEFVVESDGREFPVKYGDQVLISNEQISYLGVGELLQISGYAGDVTFTINLKDSTGLGSKGGLLTERFTSALNQWRSRPRA